MAAGEIDAPGVAGLPGQHVLSAPGSSRGRQLERDHVAVVGKLAHQLMERERTPLPARAGDQPRSVHERGMWDAVDPLQQAAKLVLEAGRAQRQLARQHV